MSQEIANSTLIDTWASSGVKIEPDVSKIIEGWQLGEQPPHEYMNWLQNTFGSKLNHILKNGVAKWNSETEYLAGATVQNTGDVWLCKTPNTNSEPTELNNNWDKIPSIENLALTVDTIDDFPTGATSGDTCIVKDLDRGGIFIYDSTKVSEDDQGTNFNGWVRQNINISNPDFYNTPIIEKVNTVSPSLLDYAENNNVFIDNLRQVNFHTSGAEAGAHTFLIPEDKFIVAEKSRSLDNVIGSLDKVLFIGDSLTAVNDNNSYTNQVARRLSNLKGGMKEIGYIAFEPTALSAKQQNLEISLTNSSGVTDLRTLLYTDEKRTYSPDGKGFAIAAGTGAENIKLTMGNQTLAKYDSVKIFYLRKPAGGTFTIRARGDSVGITVNTAGDLGLIAVEYIPNIDTPSSNQYDFWIENITGDVTVYGANFTDSKRTSGFTYDMFAISGGALWELVELQYSALNVFMDITMPDTIVINIGTNDSSQGRTPAEFLADLNTYVTRLKNTVSDLYDVKFVIITPNNMQWTNFDNNYHSDYENTRRKFARNNNYMYIDTPSEIGNFNFCWQNAMMKDGTHPNYKGLDVIGSMVADKLISNMKESLKTSDKTDYKKSKAIFTVSGGAITNAIFDGKITGVTYTSTGKYVVNHTIGTSDYVVQATGYVSRNLGCSKTSTSVYIESYSTSNALADSLQVSITLEEF